MTPMKRYKNSIDNFKSVVRSCFNITQINKSATVESDFTLLFHPKDASDERLVPSFAITFDFLGKPETAHSAIVSIKPEGEGRRQPISWFNNYNYTYHDHEKTKAELNNKIVSSHPLSVSELNEKLKETTQILKTFSATTELNSGTVFSVIKQQFLIEIKPIADSVKEARAFIEDKTGEAERDYLESVQRESNASIELEKAEKAVERSLARTKLHREKVALEKRLAELNSELKEKKKEYEEKQGISALREKKKDARKAVNNCYVDFKNKYKEAFSQLNSVVAAKLKRVFNDKVREAWNGRRIPYWFDSWRD